MRRYQKLKLSAFAVVLASGAAMAQTAPTAPMSPRPDAPSEQAAPKAPPKPIEGHINMQSDSTVMASTLIGAQVVSPTGEDMASIKDVIIKTDGTVDGVVVGVGGFLGIGEHSVAVKWDKFQLREQGGRGVQLILTATRDDLKAAEPFKSKAQIEADRKAETQRSQQSTPRTPAAPR